MRNRIINYDTYDDLPVSEDRGGAFPAGRGQNDHDRYAWLDQETLPVTLRANLNPNGFAAVHRLLNALANGVEVVVVTRPDLVRAVKELAHGSPSVGAPGVAAPGVVEPSVGGASGAGSFGAPDAPTGEAS